LNYKIGHFSSGSVDDLHVVWDTGPHSIYYTDGHYPNISLNDNGDILEVHNVTNEYYMHYIRGHVSGDSIVFASDEPRFDNRGKQGTVVLQDDGYVASLFLRPGYIGDDEVVYRLSRQDPDDPEKLIWLSDSILANASAAVYPSGLASNGNHMIATSGIFTKLSYTWAVAP
jgi:hypothetical protein